MVSMSTVRRRQLHPLLERPILNERDDRSEPSNCRRSRLATMPSKDEILTVPEEYKRGDDFAVLTGNPRRGKFSVVLLSCHQEKYGILRGKLDEIIVANPHLSLHLVPCVCDTYALLRGSMPREPGLPWLWKQVLEPIQMATEGKFDFGIFNVDPVKLRWFEVPPIGWDPTLPGVLWLNRSSAQQRLNRMPGARLVGNPSCEGELFYVLVRLQPQEMTLDNRVVDDLIAEERFRDVLIVRRGDPSEKHLMPGDDPNGAIKWPSYSGQDAILGRSEFLKRVGGIAVFHLNRNRHAALQNLFVWRDKFVQKYGLGIEIMPAVAHAEGEEFRNEMLAQSSQHSDPARSSPRSDKNRDARRKSIN